MYSDMFDGFGFYWSERLCLASVETPDFNNFLNDASLENARCVATEVRAPCTCIPALSSKNVSSMIYEGVTCKHHDVTGHAHRGVVFAQDHWGKDESLTHVPHVNDVIFHKNKRKKDRVPNTRIVTSYPHHVTMEQDSDSFDDDVSDDDVTRAPGERFPRATLAQSRVDAIDEDELQRRDDDITHKQGRRFSLDEKKLPAAKQKKKSCK